VRFRGTPAALCQRFAEASLERAFLSCIRTDAPAAAINP
jgi:hypothetical protein